MSSQAVEAAWGGYRQAVEALYRRDGDTGPIERGDVVIAMDQLDEHAAAMVEESERLHHELAGSLATDDLDQRELAALKLLAAAAYDLSVVTDLLHIDEEGLGTETERAAGSDILTDPDLRRILEAPLEVGTPGVVQVERAARSKDPAEARANLEERIAGYIEDIPDRAARVTSQAFAGVVDLGTGVLPAAVALPAQEILARLPDNITRLGRRAARLLATAIGKLRSAIGGEQEAEARKQAGEWLKELTDEAGGVAGLLARLYEAKRIEAEVDQVLGGAAQLEADQYNEANQKLEELLGRHETTTKVLIWVTRGLALAKGPLLLAPPWGPAALAAGYVGVFGYGVFVGGDYLDWHRTGDVGWLDRVQGLRTTIRTAAG
jgi:hypothetical protein